MRGVSISGRLARREDRSSIIPAAPPTDLLIQGETIMSDTNVNPIPARTPALLAQLRWTPNLAWAFGMFVLFFAILANLDATARFLYFQF